MRLNMMAAEGTEARTKITIWIRHNLAWWGFMLGQKSMMSTRMPFRVC